MDTLLAGIPGVQPYLYDIFITGTSPEGHGGRLLAVLSWVAEAGLQQQKEKCVFAATEVVFLGFCVHKHGVNPKTEKVEATRNASTPKSKTELQVFLGLLNFYSCFLEGKTTVM